MEGQGGAGSVLGTETAGGTPSPCSCPRGLPPVSWDRPPTSLCTLLLLLTVGTPYDDFPEIQLVMGSHVRSQRTHHPFNSLLPPLLDAYDTSNFPRIMQSPHGA